VDYAGIELRLIVEAAKCYTLMEVIKSGGDVHNFSTNLIYGDLWCTSKDKDLLYMMRTNAKTTAFGKGYGGGDAKMIAGLTGGEFRNYKKQITEGYREWCKALPEVANFSKNLISLIRSQGYVQSPFGRKIWVDEERPYQASNYIVQHIAAMILKRAQVRLHRYFTHELNNQMRIVMTIHDELILEMDDSLLCNSVEILTQVAKIMTSIEEIEVPLEVEMKLSRTSWLDNYKIDFRKPLQEQFK
jgi:DNA polymerase-1